MYFGRIAGTVAVAATAAFATACTRTSAPAPELATKTAEQPLNQPKTISGCLRAGEAPKTFVVTASIADGSTSTATYQLFAKPEIDLSTYVGQNVEVSGTVRSEQRVATSGTAEEKPAKGVAGTPTVETRSEVDIRKIDVTSVKSTGSRCEDR
jgi:hypothetical protein